MKVKFKFIDVVDILSYFSNNPHHMQSFDKIYSSCIRRELHTEPKHRHITPNTPPLRGLLSIIESSAFNPIPFNGQILLGYIGDELICTASIMTFNKYDYHIMGLCVSELHVGKKLCQTMLDLIIRAHKRSIFTLTVMESNTAAIRCYTKIGFQITERKTDPNGDVVLGMMYKN